MPSRAGALCGSPGPSGTGLGRPSAAPAANGEVHGTGGRWHPAGRAHLQSRGEGGVTAGLRGTPQGLGNWPQSQEPGQGLEGAGRGSAAVKEASRPPRGVGDGSACQENGIQRRTRLPRRRMESGGPRPGPANWGTATPPRVPEAAPQERWVFSSGAEPSQRRSSEPKSISHANPKHALPLPGMPAGTTPSLCPRPRLPPRSGSPGGSEGAALPDWSDLATGGRQGRSSLLPWAVPAPGSDMN